MEGNEEQGPGLISVVPNGRKRDNEHKLKYQKFNVNIRKHFLTVRMVKP